MVGFHASKGIVGTRGFRVVGSEESFVGIVSPRQQPQRYRPLY